MSERDEYHEYRSYTRKCAAVFRKIYGTLTSLRFSSDEIDSMKPSIRPILDDNFKVEDYVYSDAYDGFIGELNETLTEFGLTDIQLKIIERAIDSQLSFEFNPDHVDELDDDY